MGTPRAWCFVLVFSALASLLSLVIRETLFMLDTFLLYSWISRFVIRLIMVAYVGFRYSSIVAIPSLWRHNCWKFGFFQGKGMTHTLKLHVSKYVASMLCICYIDMSNILVAYVLRLQNLGGVMSLGCVYLYSNAYSNYAHIQGSSVYLLQIQNLIIISCAILQILVLSSNTKKGGD